MARTTERDRGPKRSSKEPRARTKKKVCIFCKEHAEWVDYKDVALLRRFMSDRGKIRSRRVTGNCTQHQRAVQVAIKTARELALLPYLQRTATERGPGRPRANREEAMELGAEAAGPRHGGYEADGLEDEELVTQSSGGEQ